MSTNNFMYDNKLFIVPGSNEEHFDDFDLQFAKDEVVVGLKDAFAGSKYTVEEYEGHDNNRSFPGQKFVDVVYQHRAKEGLIEMRATITARSGYYSGVNMDYSIEEPEFVDTYGDVPSFKYLEGARAVMLARIERVLGEICTEAKKVAQFSNGEAVYSLA